MKMKNTKDLLFGWIILCIMLVSCYQGQRISFAEGEIGPERRLLHTLQSNRSNRKLREVIGDDERVKVLDTEKYPWKTIGLIRDSSGLGVCTGVLVRDRVVLTAAQCLHNVGIARFSTDLTFSPGATNSSKPYGEFKAIAYSVPRKFARALDIQYNFGILLLDKTPPITQYMRLQPFCQEQNYSLTIAGYPDKLQRSDMWSANCPNTLIKCGFGISYVRHVCDTSSGMAGAPMWEQTMSGEFFIRAMNYGYKLSIQKNIAVPITFEVNNFIDDPFNLLDSVTWDNELNKIVERLASLPTSPTPILTTNVTDNYTLEFPEFEDFNSYLLEFDESEDNTNTGQQDNDTIISIVSILSGISFCIVVVIIVVVMWRRKIKKQTKETVEGGSLHASELEGLSSIISRELEQKNIRFNQPLNWWAHMRIPEGVREIPITDLEEVRTLGSGGFALVYEVKFKDDAREKYCDLKDKKLAVKIIYKDFVLIKDQVETFLQEVNAMRDLDNHYVVQLIGASMQIRPSILMELVVGGSLESLLYSDGFKSHQTTLQWKLKLIQNISKSIQYLHSQGITHRDLKPHNILIIDKYEATIKVSDFGLSKIAKAGSSITGACAGTTQYMAPEMCQGKRITKKVDIWALGVMMQEIIRGVKPWSGQNEQCIFYQISLHNQPPDNGELPYGDYPQELCSLIKSCWEEASRRPTIEEIVNIMNVLYAKVSDSLNMTDYSNSTSSNSKKSQLDQQTCKELSQQSQP